MRIEWTRMLLVTVALAASWAAAPADGPPPSPPAPAAPPANGVQPAPGPPGFLDRPLESPFETPTASTAETPVTTPVLPPLGFTGPSSILPREEQSSNDFVPVEDRWRIGFPAWDRYDWGHPPGLDYPYTEGHWWDPYNQNVLKGDYPICGQNTFLNVTAISFTQVEVRDIPTATTPFESTQRPGEVDFFGRPVNRPIQQFFRLSFDLFHGDTEAFKPVDWRIKITPVFNINYLAADELAVVDPDVKVAADRARSWTTIEEYFFETKLTDLSPDYDFMSLRVGSQPFNSDFRGLIFADTNRAVRIFGSQEANRDQFNIIYFRQAEKDTESGLNSFNDRGQDIFIMNYYRQDFIWPGYTTQVSLHYNHDKADFKFDRDGFLVRPDPVGVFQPHEVNAFYFGWTGDGHINRLNIDHAFYWAVGRDTLNPLAGQVQNINAQLAALELSYSRDWARFRGSFFWASGDRDISNRTASGFDSILDDQNFAGGKFSFWQRQPIPLFGVQLKTAGSLLPDLRSSKIQGQSNFVNPGLWLGNVGVDFDITPKLRMINNVNALWFAETGVLSQFVFQQHIRHGIGTDLSSGFEYRPTLSNNIIMDFGLSTLIPGDGFRDLYNSRDHSINPLVAGFLELTLAY